MNADNKGVAPTPSASNRWPTRLPRACGPVFSLRHHLDGIPTRLRSAPPCNRRRCPCSEPSAVRGPQHRIRSFQSCSIRRLLTPRSVSHAAIQLELQEGRSAPQLGGNVHEPRQDRGKARVQSASIHSRRFGFYRFSQWFPVAIRVHAPQWGRWVNAIIKHMNEKLQNASLPSGQRPSLTVPSGPILSGRAMRERACA